ncbi:MAG: hypothetical protein ACI86M_002920 [Saprospiraceae bacterium]|jgi:hypothetical protein
MEKESNKLDQKKALDKAVRKDLGVDKEAFKKLKKKLLKAEGKPERGIETWFRLTSKNLYARLQIVDTKANILITANAIIISMILGTLYTKLQEDPHMIYAVGGLALTNILSISFAIIATIPKAMSIKAPEKRLASADLMTFDDFHDMSLVDYKKSVMEVIETEDTLYPSIITDIHNLGVVLARKYKLIRISYLVFLYGIIISAFLFSMCHFYFG